MSPSSFVDQTNSLKPSVLITGSAGFIGSHLAERLLLEGNRVLGIDNFDPFYSRQLKAQNLSVLRAHPGFRFVEGDLADATLYQTLPTDIDVVVHLAAKAGVRPSIEGPLSYVEANIKATNLLLDWMQSHRLKHYVFASSSSVYGNREETPFRDSDSVDNPISPYAFTKKSCELMNYTYYHLHDISTVNLRFFTVYGPRQRPDLAINKFVRLIRAGEPIPMFGDGTTARDYTFVEDTVDGVIRAIDFVMRPGLTFETINLGNDRPTPLKELILTLYELLDEEPNIQQLPMQPGDVNITCASVEKARALLGYAPRTGRNPDCRIGLCMLS
ncbi:MAG: NAD-dependent epimerase/dehydratase family protein [Catalinimonas sp.]